jgi:hypothetical protein
MYGVYMDPIDFLTTMKQRSLTKNAIITILLFSISIFPAMAADEEALGNQAEQEEKLR